MSKMGVLKFYELNTKENTYHDWHETDLKAREWAKWVCSQGEDAGDGYLSRVNTSERSVRYGIVEKAWNVKAIQTSKGWKVTCERCI